MSADLTADGENPISVSVSAPITVTIDVDTILGAWRPRGWDEDGDEVRGEQLADVVLEAVAERLARKLEVDVRNNLEPVIRERIGALVDGLLARGVQPTDTWGTPKGEPTTIAELVQKEAADYLGQPAKNSSGYRPDGNPTRLQHAVKEAVDRAWTRELSAAVAAGKKQVMDEVTKKAAEVVAETVGKLR